MKYQITVFLLVLSVFYGCSSDDAATKDTEKPEINLAIAGGFPTSCATVKRGEAIPFKALLSDNEQLGSYSIGIHHNFDHHSHDTEVDQCEFSPVQLPINPWVKTFTFTIPTGQKQFTAQQEFAVPDDIDTGDYHFIIQLTDAQGWATMKGISIKIIE